MFSTIVKYRIQRSYLQSNSIFPRPYDSGLTALTSAVLFLVALFLSPLFLSIPAAETSPALIIVGFFMMSPIKDIELDNPSEGIPAFPCILMRVLTYSISDDIMFGIISYVIFKAVKRDLKALNPMTLVVAALFLMKMIIT